MAEDRMAEMMEPFTRMEGSRSRDTGGAGLGLALVRAIMAEHGGELRLANRPEGGLRASLVLPDHMEEAAKDCIRIFTSIQDVPAAYPHIATPWRLPPGAEKRRIRGKGTTHAHLQTQTERES